MDQPFDQSDLISLIASLLGVNQEELNEKSVASDFDLWDSVMQLEIIATLDSHIPGLLEFCPELPSKTSVAELQAEIFRFQNS
jgi:hypothetical protein